MHIWLNSSDMRTSGNLWMLNENNNAAWHCCPTVPSMSESSSEGLRYSFLFLFLMGFRWSGLREETLPPAGTFSTPTLLLWCREDRYSVPCVYTFHQTVDCFLIFCFHLFPPCTLQVWFCCTFFVSACVLQLVTSWFSQNALRRPQVLWQNVSTCMYL